MRVRHNGLAAEALRTISKADFNAEWPKVMLENENLTVALAFKAMGLDIDDPSLPPSVYEPLMSDIKTLTTRLKKTPVCHVLYTGTKSYRDVLLSRYAA